MQTINPTSTLSCPLPHAACRSTPLAQAHTHTLSNTIDADARRQILAWHPHWHTAAAPHFSAPSRRRCRLPALAPLDHRSWPSALPPCVCCIFFLKFRYSARVGVRRWLYSTPILCMSYTAETPLPMMRLRKSHTLGIHTYAQSYTHTRGQGQGAWRQLASKQMPDAHGKKGGAAL